VNVTRGRGAWKSAPAARASCPHAGLVLLRGLADRTGLTAGLSKALASDRLLIMTGAG